jgi:tRNA threonylcarbamoyladenosine biosynthesis protein TsaB
MLRVSFSIARHGAILGFDTATAVVAVAVTRSGECVAERSLASGSGSHPRHAAKLLGEIETAVESAGGWHEVDLLAVGLGPGSFTGLRVGIATARALAQARGLPVAGVPSLDALARGIGELPAAAERPRLAVIDAKRSQVFAALHGPDGRRVWGPLVTAPGELADRLGSPARPALAAGDGAVRFRRDLERAGAEVLPDEDAAHRLSGRHVCLLAEELAPSAPEEIKPIYLRPPDAEIWRERDRGESSD